MTEITNISIRGFKGIDEVDVDAGRINIITGRNNTGKTSFLESINLLFNSADFPRFGDNVNNIINAHKSETKISCEFYKTGQLSLDEFDDDGISNIEERDFKIRNPEKAELLDMFVDGVIEIAETGPDSGFFVDRFFSEEFKIEEMDISSESILQAVKDGVAGLSEDDVQSQVEGNAVVISVDGVDYPYLYFGDFYDNIKDKIITEAVNAFALENPELFQNSNDEIQYRIGQMFNDLLVPRFGSGRFIYDSPEPIEGVEFVDSIMVSKSDVDTENAAVRMSNIEDYIQKHNIVNNLDDFSFDDLVFEENGEKYQVPYEFMGDGFKAIVGILWALTDQESSGNILLLEEPENHMHPGYINKMVHQLTQLSMDNDMQLFVTTHNIDFLRSFFSSSIVGDKEEFLRKELKVFQMEQDTTQSISYEEAENRMNELQLDLRGL